MSNEDFDSIVVEEYDRQTKYYNDLQRMNFFDNNELVCDISPEQKKKIKKERAIAVESYTPDDEDDYDKEAQNNQTADNISLETSRPIDFINHKISKLDSIFSSISAVEDDPTLWNVEPSFKKKEELQRLKEIEDKQINLFAGIYSVKSVMFIEKTKIPPPISLRVEQNELVKAPKLVETYQFSGYLGDSAIILSLPHEVEMKNIQYKVFDSILILERQPYYRDFLRVIYFGELFQKFTVDTFWWCFLEKYQKTESIQHQLFIRISETYVEIIFLELDPRYKETFFKSMADLLAMTVYTIFTTCFPESFLTQFTDEFKEFLCQVCHLWITGCKPIPRSYYKWNFKMLDPESATRTREMLKKNQNASRSMTNVSNHTQSNLTLNQSRTTNHSMSNTTSKNPSSIKTRRTNSSYIVSNYSKLNRVTSSKSLPQKESHPVGPSHKIQSSLFNLNGHSPLIECYLYYHNSRKINKADTLVNHATVVGLPPLNTQTYKDVIKESVKAIRKIEKDIKSASARHQKESLRLEKDRIRYMRQYKKNQDLLLSKPKQCGIMGELITMSKQKDPYTCSFNLDTALTKALKKSGATEIKSIQE